VKPGLQLPDRGAGVDKTGVMKACPDQLLSNFGKADAFN